ncbi:MAG TPA: hypothetical protein VFY18_01630 [Candidatus Limnocylindrales bacterium]|nr:hypothetical protein [Candidatus Limnocylindrales bacterium]
MGDLAAVEARLDAILEPYRTRLETFEIYGVPMLRRPGARAHDWFAGVSPGNGVIRFFLLPMYAHPELLEGISPELRKRKRGASLFAFTNVDDGLIEELTALTERSFAAYTNGDEEAPG